MHPGSDHDGRAVDALLTMDQQVAPAHAQGDGEHDVFELLRGDRARIGDWNVDVDDLRRSLHRLLAAERNDRRDASRIGARQLRSILEIAEIEAFPDLCHWFPGLVSTVRSSADG